MQEHEGWLKIVEDDLKSARRLSEFEVFSTAVYHCQQAAEKALKAYLVFKKQEVVKVHDLVKLVMLCCRLDKDFDRLYDGAEWLNPFVTRFRYPTEFEIPDYEDTKVAVDKAQRIVDFVIKKIAEPETGQQELF